MAQIVTITNPLTGQPAQVDQLEHTAQQIDDAIDRAKAGGEIDTLLNGKAKKGAPVFHTFQVADGVTVNREHVYWKDEFNIVHLYIQDFLPGSDVATWSGLSIGTLPEGFRPANIYYFQCLDLYYNANNTRVYVYANGAIKIATGAETVPASHHMSFYGEWPASN